MDLFVIKSCITALIGIVQIIILVFSLSKLQNESGNLNAKGKWVVGLSGLSCILAIVLIWTDNKQQEQSGIEVTRIHKQYIHHIDSISIVNKRMMVEYNLERNNESTKIIQKIEATSSGLEPLLTTVFDLESIRISNDRLGFNLGVRNCGTAIAYNAKGNVKLIYRVGGEFIDGSPDPINLTSTTISNFPNLNYSLDSVLYSYSQNYPDTLYFLTSLTYTSSNNKKYRKQYVDVLFPRTRQIYTSVYKNDPQLHAHLIKIGLKE